MAEMFTLFPHESAVVMQRGIELGIICSCLLVVHCSWLVFNNWSSDHYPDTLLRGMCLARIVCALPRPYFWLHTRQLFIEARYQPTPQFVTQRLLDIYVHPFCAERALLLFYYGWLVLVGCFVCVVNLDTVTTTFAQQIWQHVILNGISIVLHRIVCVFLFYTLIQSDFKRGILPDVLEKYTKRLAVASGGDKLMLDEICGVDAECSICLGSYADGDEVRKLNCGHVFHQHCVDVWLLQHQNRCPLCLHVVGPHQ